MLVRLQLAELSLFLRDFKFKTDYFSLKTRDLLLELGNLCRSALFLVLLVILHFLDFVLQTPFLVFDHAIPGIEFL